MLDSPMEFIAEFEGSVGLPAGAVNRAVAGRAGDGAWARLERGEIDRHRFAEAFADELGGIAPALVAGMLDALDRDMRERPVVIERIRRLRRDGLLVAALTNNWNPFPPRGLRDEFDVFVESVTEGRRKPEPEIYHVCLERLGEPAEGCLMLDDIGANLKTARDLGMVTILVRSPQQMLDDLDAALRGHSRDG